MRGLVRGAPPRFGPAAGTAPSWARAFVKVDTKQAWRKRPLPREARKGIAPLPKEKTWERTRCRWIKSIPAQELRSALSHLEWLAQFLCLDQCCGECSR